MRKILLLFLIFGLCTLAYSTQLAGVDKHLLAELKRYGIDDAESLLRPIVSKKVNTGLFYELESKSSVVRYVYVGRVETARGAQSVGTVADYLDYFILFDANKVVRKVKITKFQSNHGQTATSVGWLKQFVGYRSGKSLEVGREVDAISGATLTVNRLTFDIKSKTQLLSN